GGRPALRQTVPGRRLAGRLPPAAGDLRPTGPTPPEQPLASPLIHRPAGAARRRTAARVRSMRMPGAAAFGGRAHAPAGAAPRVHAGTPPLPDPRTGGPGGAPRAPGPRA